MKPLKLTIANIRSYRSHEPITFSDAALIALLGNTGAGKSTLLDAIVLALYGKTVDTQLNLEDLIAPRETHMSVTLLFGIDGREYEAHRLIRRRGQGIHKLTKPDGTVVTGSSDVTRAVEDLLGLGSATFLKTVLLPQGRFADLLTAKASERQTVFRDLFGLDQIDDVGRIAGEQFGSVDALRLTTLGSRLTIAGNPRERLPQLEAGLVEARAAVSALEITVREYTLRTTEIEKLSTELTQLKDVARRIGDVDVTPKMLSDIRSAAKDLDKQLLGKKQDLERDEAAAKSARAVVTRLQEEKRDAATLRTIQTALDGLEHELRERESDKRKLDEAIKRAHDRAAELLHCQAEARKADELLTPLAAKDTEVRQKVETLAKALTRYQDVDAEREKASKALEREQQALAALDVLLKVSVKRLTAVTDERDAAGAEASRDQEAFEAASRADMAAAVAAHVHPGDACPVCEQPVPPAFVPRVAPELKAAGARADASAKALEAAEALLRTQEKARAAADASHSSQHARVTGAQLDFAKCDEKLHALAQPEDPKAYKARLDRSQLELTATAAAVAKKVKEATAVVQASRDAVTRAEANAKTAADTQRAAEKTYETRVAAITKRTRQIPERLGLAPDGSDLARVRQVVEQDLDAAEAAEEQVVTLESRVQATQSARDRLQLRYAETVTQPLSHVILSFNRAVEFLSLDRLTPDTRSDSPALDVIFEAIATTTRKTNASISKLESAIEAETDRRAQLLVGIADGDASAALTGAKLDVQRLELEHQKLMRDVDVAESLDRKLDAITPVATALETVKQFMGVSYFKAYLAEQRAARVVAIGSRFLYGMTKRYQFTPSFDIQDLHNGTVRPSSSLSGGEKFLASLALSLAVVEQAAVGGAKIESLFLDEGFATLDAEYLDVAMQELRSQARQGHAIWIITHLRDAAVYAHESYMIERTPEGSQVRLLDAIPDDAPSVTGLLEALS